MQVHDQIKNIADHLVFHELEVADDLDDAQAVRKAKQARTKALVADAGQRDASEGAGDIRAQAAAFRQQWAVREPKAVAHCFTDFAKTFSYVQVDFPRSRLPLIRTPNLLERLHKAVRRQQGAIGMLHSERGGEVLWYLLATRESAKQRAALKGQS
jgi:transposase-like protein